MNGENLRFNCPGLSTEKNLQKIYGKVFRSYVPNWRLEKIFGKYMGRFSKYMERFSEVMLPNWRQSGLFDIDKRALPQVQIK